MQATQVEPASIAIHVIGGSLLTAIGLTTAGAWWLVGGLTSILVTMGACSLWDRSDTSNMNIPVPRALVLLVLWIVLWAIVTPMVLHELFIARAICSDASDTE